MSSIAGMGAIPFEGGVAFRVWAPHATAVAVKGSFSAWAPQQLEAEENGYWYGEVVGAAAGDEYLFVLRNGDNVFDRVDPYARQVTNSVGNAVVYDHAAFDWHGDDFSLGNFRDLAIYELHANSFVDGWGAPLTDVASKFGHLAHLGVNALELMPVMEFAGDLSWGYNPAHIFAVESSYGGPDALKTFVREAHKAGFAVILDVVYNHFGPSDLATWQFDGWSDNNKGGIYFYNDERSSTPWGDTRPDYGRPEVRNFIRDNVFQWLRDYHVDGLRYDMTPYIRSTDGWETNIPDGYSLMQWINNDVRREFPEAILIAEDLHGDDSITSSDGAAFHAQWDAEFVHPVRRNLEEVWDDDRSLDELIGAITHEVSGNPFARVVYTESHDEDANGSQRMNSEVDPAAPGSWLAQKRSTLGTALVFTTAGIPMIFQGQEFMQGGYFTDSATLDWHLTDTYHGIVLLYRDLVALRRNSHGMSLGLQGDHTQILHHDETGKVLAFHRWMNGGPGDDVVVVANFSDQEYTSYALPWAGEGYWQLLLNSDAQIYSPDFGNSQAGDLEIVEQEQAIVHLAPYSVLIYGRR